MQCTKGLDILTICSCSEVKSGLTLRGTFSKVFEDEVRGYGH